MTRKLVLLASYPKSGNTWMRAFLTSLWRDGNDVDINELMIPSVSSRRLIDNLIGISSAELGIDEIAGLRPAAYAFAAQQVAPEKRLFLKTHDALLPFSPGLPAPFLEESIDRIVYMIRDPRDVAPSLSRHINVSLDSAISIMADATHRLSFYPWRPGVQLTHFISSWSGHVNSWAFADARSPMLIVRFEDIVADPVEAFSRVVEFLNLSVHRSRIPVAVEATRLSTLREKERLVGFAEKPPGSHTFFYEGRPNAWASTLTRTQAETIEKDHAEIMSQFGYGPYG